MFLSHVDTLAVPPLLSGDAVPCVVLVQWILPQTTAAVQACLDGRPPARAAMQLHWDNIVLVVIVFLFL